MGMEYASLPHLPTLTIVWSYSFETVVTVRSEEKGNQIIKAHPEAKEKLSYVIVKDVAKDGAFDEVSGALLHHMYITDEVTGRQVRPAIRLRSAYRIAFPFQCPRSREGLLGPCHQGYHWYLEGRQSLCPNREASGDHIILRCDCQSQAASRGLQREGVEPSDMGGGDGPLAGLPS